MNDRTRDMRAILDQVQNVTMKEQVDVEYVVALVDEHGNEMDRTASIYTAEEMMQEVQKMIPRLSLHWKVEIHSL